MKNKILTLLTLFLLVFTSLNVVGSGSDNNNSITMCEKKEIISFSELTITTEDKYLVLNFNEANSYLNSPGKPLLPFYVKTYKFPIGTKIYDVECLFSDVKKEVLLSKVKPAPNPVPLISLKTSIDNVDKQEKVEDVNVYSSFETYPDKWFEYNIGVGLDGKQRVIFLTIRIYPVLYSPGEDTIYYIEDADVKITYEQGV
ncbi:MAG: hypothetical protein QHH15_06445, partial [Candidatus Thermoplasmatota archaeon]|nr:hypothetical protein [Candidatus Thermoplasmatota archaeon]